MTIKADEFVIYYNPRCSKSRAALDLLQQLDEYQGRARCARF
jgi:hypothetical protein